MKTREFSIAHFIILLGLCLTFLVIVPDELAWAGEANQTVPTVPTETATVTEEPTETATPEIDEAATATAEAETAATATATNTAISTATATATSTATLDGTRTNTPFMLPTDIVDDGSAGNIRTYLGFILVLLLVFGMGIGSLIWWLLRRSRQEDQP